MCTEGTEQTNKCQTNDKCKNNEYTTVEQNESLGETESPLRCFHAMQSRKDSVDM